MQGLFIELLQVTLGTRDSLSRVPSSIEWEYLLAEAQRQAILGIMTSGLERLPDDQRPPKSILLNWIGACQQIESRNSITTKACFSVCEQFEKDGFITCVLKGQANHRYYPEEMQNRRSCGDVDLWVVPGDRNCKNPVKAVLEYEQRSFDMNVLCWLHTGHTDMSGVPIEVHLRPSFMSEPCKNRRFLKHFSDIEACLELASLDGGQIPALKVDEDVIYQMNHIYRHLIDEGVGLRQIVDYYYLLRSWNEKHSRTKEETMRIVSWLGMKKFADALMFVLRHICGMPEELLLCPGVDKDGLFLMNEILLSGNFGHTDPRMANINAKGGYYNARVNQAWRRLKRNMRFLTSYPGEVIWEPIVRVEHFVWKKLKLWRF